MLVYVGWRVEMGEKEMERIETVIVDVNDAEMIVKRRPLNFDLSPQSLGVSVVIGNHHLLLRLRAHHQYRWSQEPETIPMSSYPPLARPCVPLRLERLRLQAPLAVAERR